MGAAKTQPSQSDSSSSSTAADSAVNDQISDALSQLQNSIAGVSQPFAAAAAYQLIAHSLSLALQNAVTQQQHSHMLRSALTTAAAKALLEGKSDEAQAVLQLAESRLVNPNFAEEIGQLQAVVKSLCEDLRQGVTAMYGNAAKGGAHS